MESTEQKNVWSIYRDEQGFAAALVENGYLVVHLTSGTVRNGENIERVVALLNQVSELNIRVKELEDGIDNAFSHAHNRWDEWGERAVHTAEILEKVREKT